MYLVVRCLSLPSTHDPALELKDFWAFIAWGVEAAHRDRGWRSHIPPLAMLRECHKTGSNVWFFHLPLRNADILFRVLGQFGEGRMF